MFERGSLAVDIKNMGRIAGEFGGLPHSVRIVAKLDATTWPPGACSSLGKPFAAEPRGAPPGLDTDGRDFEPIGDAFRAAATYQTPVLVEAGVRARAALGALRLGEFDSRLSWRVDVMEDPTPFAFGVPDGSLLVSDALVARVSDDELTAVRAHLMGHEWYRHGRRIVSAYERERFAVTLGSILSVVAVGHPGGATLGGRMYYRDLLSHPVKGYSPDWELDAN